MYNLFLHFIADYLVIIIALVGAVIMLRLPATRRYELWSRAIITGLVALLFAKAASLLYQGQRPFEALGVEPGAAFLPNPGFPSDHALLVFTIAAVVWASTKHVWFGGGLLAGGAVVAIGRVLALVHTPIDVLGGFLCALIAALLVYGRDFFTLRR